MLNDSYFKIITVGSQKAKEERMKDTLLSLIWKM